MHCHYLCKGNARYFILLVIFIASTLAVGCGEEEAPLGTVLIEGDAVNEKATFTLDELKAMEDGLVEADYFAVNSYGTKGYSHFKGIWVWHLLQERVSLKEDASKVSFIAEDGYKVEYSIEDVKKEDYIDEQNPQAKYKMILAWEEEGREYDMKHGNPFQLVVGQKALGDVNKPYWVRNIKTIRID
ncbi:MAG: molybdopterin-dependent oxidoreductase [Desulfitobacteriaceae bacterium]|nr:molybdopterin-dependent oxidoreductase [Desulfitobacteriaceae bacterium]